MNRIQQWILNKKFFNDYVKGLVQRERETNNRALYIKAFSDAQKDLEETNIYNTETKAKAMAEQMLNDMLSNVDLNSIVTADKQGLVYIGGVKADQGQLANLKSEVEMLETTFLWKLLQETPKELAQRGMFVSGETLADMQKGKTILYVLSVQKNIVNIFKSYKGK